MTGEIITVVQFASLLFTLALVVRVLASWLAKGMTNPVLEIIHKVTEPVLRPIRQLLPPMGMLDLSPLVALMLVKFAESIVVRILISL